MITRLLTQVDMPDVVDIINGRTSFLTSSPLNKEYQVGLAHARMARGDRFVGLFEADGSLDGFFTYRVLPHTSPRADDFERSEAAAVLDSLWSRKRAGRVKLPLLEPDPLVPGGDDLNFGTLFAATVQTMEDEGIFTFWGITAIAFRGHYLNQVYAPMQAKRLVVTGATMAPGGIPFGPLEDFVRSALYTYCNPHEEMIFRVHTLLDAYRT